MLNSESCPLSKLAKPAGLEQEEAVLAEAVKAHVSRHPQSMDTVEGISEWWIPDSVRRPTLPALLRVLQKLSDEGVLDRVVRGELVHYRARRQ